MKIWHAPRTRSSRIVWQCEEMGLGYEVQPVSLRGDEAFKAISPLGGVPLFEDDGRRMIESVAIMLYIAERYGPTPLAPAPDEPIYSDYLQFLVAGEASLGSFINILMYDRYRCPDEEKGGWISRNRLEAFDRAAGWVADTLKNRAYVAGDRFTLADISVGYAFYVAVTFLGLGERLPPRVRDYLEELEARPAFQTSIAA